MPVNLPETCHHVFDSKPSSFHGIDANDSCATHDDVDQPTTGLCVYTDQIMPGGPKRSHSSLDLI